MVRRSGAGTFSYKALRFAQTGRGGPKLVMFHAPVRDVLKWATVEELRPKTRGPQRQRREAKVEAICKFLNANVSNTIPTTVIVAFTRLKTSYQGGDNTSNGKLIIRPGEGFAAAIVDGQHRLHGMNAFAPDTQVPVVGLLDADRVEKAFQFLVINNKATKVPATHTKALLAKMEGTALSERLRGARLAFDANGIKDVDLVNSDREGPFYNTVDWETTPKAKRMIPATAIEQSLDYLAGLGVPELDDRDVSRSVFLTIWRVIKDNWSSLWKSGTRLVSKVGIVSMTRFIADLIVSWADNEELEIDLSDLEDIATQTKKIVSHMDTKFWTVPWSEKAHGGFDTNQGRDRVLAALRQLYRNGKSRVEWHTDIDIVDPTGVDES